MPAGTPIRITAPLVLCTLLLAAGSGACSYIFVDGPPAAHRRLNYFTCSSNNTLPTTDVVLGGLFAVSAIETATNGASQSQQGPKIAGAVGVAGLAALFAASAYSGYKKTSECRDALADLQERTANMQLQNSMGYGAGPPGSPAFQPPSARDPWVTPPTGIFSKPPTDDTAPTPSSNSPSDNEVSKKKR